MKDISVHSMRLYQKAFIGKWSLDLHPKELLMLKLRFAPEEKILELWAELWEGISDYDDLPAACRALMPIVIRRIQIENISEDWKIVHGLDLSYLVGLPRYVWTRNKIMLKQTKRIASHVGEAGIEIVAIKGMGDLISGAEDGMMRSTVDLDLLIRPDDVDVFKIKMNELGYELQEHIDSASLIPHDQLQFVPTNGTQSYVDLHLMANRYQEDDRLTATIWKEKIPSNVCPTLFVPSRRERFWLSVANAFRLHNWQTESHLKYLNDALSYLSESDGANIEETLEKGKKTHELQDWQEQVIQLGCDLDILQNKSHVRLDKTNNNNSNSKINKTINSIKDYKIYYALQLVDKYTQKWRARNTKGNYWKVMLFLSSDLLYQVSNFIWRRIRNPFRAVRSHEVMQTNKYHKKLRDIKWNI